MRRHPAAREQRPMPTTNRFRAHEQTAPPITRKRPGQMRQDTHPIGWTTTRPADLPTKHRELVTQDQQLDLVRGVRAATQHRKSEEVSKHPVDARDKHPTILPTRRPTRRT